MKKISFLQFFALFIFSILMISCESHEQKADPYVQSKYRMKIVKDEKSKKHAKNVSLPKVEKPISTIGAPNEWLKFKLDTESKIGANERKITKLKALPNSSSKELRQLESLEKINNDLRTQLAIFNEEVTVKWENFKTSINFDINKINIELEEISSNNSDSKTK